LRTTPSAYSSKSAEPPGRPSWGTSPSSAGTADGRTRRWISGPSRKHPDIPNLADNFDPPLSRPRNASEPVLAFLASGTRRKLRRIPTGLVSSTCGTLPLTHCDRFGNQCAVGPIIPRLRKEPFDDPAWTFEPKLDGFRGIADTIHGRTLSRNRIQVNQGIRGCRLGPRGGSHRAPRRPL